LDESRVINAIPIIAVRKNKKIFFFIGVSSLPKVEPKFLKRVKREIRYNLDFSTSLLPSNLYIIDLFAHIVYLTPITKTTENTKKPRGAGWLSPQHYAAFLNFLTNFVLIFFGS